MGHSFTGRCIHISLGPRLKAGVQGPAVTCRNPAWGAGTILVGLLSFMGETALTTGSVSSSKAEKRRLAAASLDYNMRRCQPVASPSNQHCWACVRGTLQLRGVTALLVGQRSVAKHCPPVTCQVKAQASMRGVPVRPSLCCWRSARFRRLFPEYREEHARRQAAMAKARKVTLTDSPRCASGATRDPAMHGRSEEVHKCSPREAAA